MTFNTNKEKPVLTNPERTKHTTKFIKRQSNYTSTNSKYLPQHHYYKNLSIIYQFEYKGINKRNFGTMAYSNQNKNCFNKVHTSKNSTSTVVSSSILHSE